MREVSGGCAIITDFVLGFFLYFFFFAYLCVCVDVANILLEKLCDIPDPDLALLM